MTAIIYKTKEEKRVARSKMIAAKEELVKKLQEDFKKI